MIPDEELGQTKLELLAEIAVCMGGRAGEEVMFGSSGVGQGQLCLSVFILNFVFKKIDFEVMGPVYSPADDFLLNGSAILDETFKEWSFIYFLHRNVLFSILSTHCLCNA